MADERPLLAVLIDADNVPARHAAAILEEIKSLGEAGARRVYGDWSAGGLNAWSQLIPRLGLVARQVSANIKGKNASDIGMVIDAMDLLHRNIFDQFVIVSSDSDFTALANRLREAGKPVIGIGEQKVPESLRNVCNRFIFIENISEEAAKDAVKEADEKKTPLPKPVKPLPLFEGAFDKLDDVDGWYHLGPVGNQILAAKPDFDPRSYGHAKLSAMVKSLNGLDTKQNGTHLMIRLKP